MQVGSQAVLSITSINSQAQVEIVARVARLLVNVQVLLISFKEAQLVQAL